MYLNVHVDQKIYADMNVFYGSNTLKQRQVLERQNNSTPLKYRNFHANNLRLIYTSYMYRTLRSIPIKSISLF